MRIIRGATSRHAAMLLLLLTLPTIATITLTPLQHLEPGRSGVGPMLCLVCGQQDLVDTLLNVALFLPFGLALRLLGLSTRSVLLISAVTSLGIEALQWGVVVGRQPQIRDVLANTLGGAFGANLASVWRGLLIPSPRVAGRLAGASTAIWVIHLLLASWALAPSPPRAVERYWVQWAHVFPDSWPFRGEITSVDLNGAPIRDGPIADVRTFESVLMSVPSALNVSAIGALPTMGRSQIVAIGNEAYRVAARLQQDECDFEFKVRLRAADLGLNYPAVKLDAPCRSDPNSPLLLSGKVAEDGLTLLARDGDGIEKRQLLFTPNLGWSLLHPFDLAYSDSRLATAVWIAALLFLVSYWTSQAARAPLKVAALTTTIIASLMGLPLIFGFQAIPWTEWAAAAFGVLAGLGAGQIPLLIGVGPFGTEASERSD